MADGGRVQRVSGHQRSAADVQSQRAGVCRNFVESAGKRNDRIDSNSKIGVNIPIYYGTEEQQLRAGAGFWMGSSLPTGGPSTHTVLTAHTGLVRAKLFTDIDKLKNGDRFFIRVLDRTLAYEVDQRMIVDPDEMEPMYIQPGEDLVTLYTCYPYGVNTQRLLVRGHRIPYEEDPEDSENLAEKLLKNYWIWILVILIILLLLWWLLHRHRKKKKTKPQKETDVEKTDGEKTGENDS